MADDDLSAGIMGMTGVMAQSMRYQARMRLAGEIFAALCRRPSTEMADIAVEVVTRIEQGLLKGKTE